MREEKKVCNDEQAAPSQRKRLTIGEIEELSREEFDALPEADRRRYFRYMDRENSPSAWEFYGYAEEFETSEDWLAKEMESCDGQDMPEPTPERQPNDQEPTQPARLDAEGLFGEVIF